MLAGVAPALARPRDEQDSEPFMSMRPDHVDLMIHYALAVAGEADNYRDRELGPIHLLKYVYLGDLAFAKEHGGEAFSGTRWTFFKFGPWSAEVHSHLPVAVAKIGAQERHFSSKYREDNIRWLLLNVDTAELGRRLPQPVAAAIRNSVAQNANDTVSLLHCVYRTAPMLAAAPGESLILWPLPEIDEKKVPDQVVEAGSKPLPTISRTKLKNLKQKIEKLYEEKKNREARELVPPDPPPIYDDVYFQGVDWLEHLAGSPIDASHGRLIFDDSIWKSPGRRDPELP
jgi:hypothetical protein